MVENRRCQVRAIKHRKQPGIWIVLLVCLGMLAACGGRNQVATSQTSTEAGSTSIRLGVVPGQLRFDQERITVKTGELITIHFINNDPTMPHNFVIDEPRVVIPQQDTIIGLAAGQEGTATFTAPKPGLYEYYCSVPGHREAGMVGVLEVIP